MSVLVFIKCRAIEKIINIIITLLTQCLERNRLAIMVASNNNCNSNRIYFISGENIFKHFEKCLPYCLVDYIGELMVSIIII